MDKLKKVVKREKKRKRKRGREKYECRERRGGMIGDQNAGRRLSRAGRYLVWRAGRYLIHFDQV